MPLGASSLFLDPYASDIAAAEGFGFGRVGKGGGGGGGGGGGAVAFSPELRGHGGDSHQHHLGEGEEDQVIINAFFKKNRILIFVVSLFQLSHGSMLVASVLPAPPEVAAKHSAKMQEEQSR